MRRASDQVSHSPPDQHDTVDRLVPPLRAFAPSAKLTVRRLRARPLAAVATTVALIAAGGLVGWSSLSSAVAEARSVTLRLRELPPQGRALRVVYYEVAGSPDLHARQVAAAAASFHDLTGGTPFQVTIWHPVAPSDPAGTSFVVPKSLAADATILAGRSPRGGCGPQRCEAVALSPGLHVGQTFRVGPVRVTVVGIGSLRPVAAPAGSAIASKMLLVRSLDDHALEQLVRSEAGMTSVTTAPLDPNRVHASSLARVVSRLHDTVVRLNRSDTEDLVQATAPTATLTAIERRGTVARERLLLIAAQAAALVIAFAAFAASSRRREVQLLRSQLVDLGATRLQAWIAGALEVVAPGVAALLVTFGGLAAVAVLRAPASTAPGSFVSTALPVTTVFTIIAIVVIAMGLLVSTASRSSRRRFGIGPLEASALLAFAVIVWQGVTSNGLDVSKLASSDKDSPLLLLLPALCFFVSAVVLLRLLPLLTQLGERLARRAPAAVRLALLGAARSPAQTAAATAFLAVAVGAATFSLDYRATLERQAHDQASFAAGALWRVAEQSTQATASPGPFGLSGQTAATSDDVLPLTRYALVSKEPPTPVLRERGEQLGVGAGAAQAGDRSSCSPCPPES